MDLNALQAFIAVAQSGSFSVAADQLHLTQPAVSKRIAGLEQQLDLRLFDRIGKTTHMTEAGQTLLPKARAILAEVDESKRLLSNLSGKISGKLRLGTSHHIGLHRLPDVLRRYRSAHPEVALDIRFTDSELACDSVVNGELEMAVVTLPEVADTQLEQQIIWTDPLVFVCDSSHPLSKLEPGISIHELSQHEALLPSSSTITRKIVDELFESQQLRPRIGMETNYLETLKMMASIGLGWTALPELMVGNELHCLKIKGRGLERHLGIITHRDRTLSNAALAFKAMFGTSNTAQ